MNDDGEPDDRKGHVRFEVAGAGIRLVQPAVGVCKPSLEMDRTERRCLRLSTAPALDPTRPPSTHVFATEGALVASSGSGRGRRATRTGIACVRSAAGDLQDNGGPWIVGLRPYPRPPLEHRRWPSSLKAALYRTPGYPTIRGTTGPLRVTPRPSGPRKALPRRDALPL
jgi:hypothetical protein